MRLHCGRLPVAILLVVAALLGGCASFEFTKPAPALSQPVTLKTSGEELSGWTDLPIGVYRVPESHVIISGHQKGQVAGLMFGLIGVAVAHAANATAGQDAVKAGEEQLRIKLTQPVDDAIRKQLASGAFSTAFTLEDKPGVPKLLVTPALLLSFVSDDAVRPYVILKASLTGSEGKPAWTTRYIASSGEARTLLGADGWLVNNGAELRKSVQANLEVAVRTLVADVAKPYARDDTKMVMVEGNLPYLKQRVKAVGYSLTEDDRFLTFIPKVGDVLVFSGVNVMDRSVITFRPATKEDPPLKLVEEAAK